MSRKISDFFLKAVTAAQVESGNAKSSLQKRDGTAQVLPSNELEKIETNVLKKTVGMCGDTVQETIMKSQASGVVAKKTLEICDKTFEQTTVVRKSEKSDVVIEKTPENCHEIRAQLVLKDLKKEESVIQKNTVNTSVDKGKVTKLEVAKPTASTKSSTATAEIHTEVEELNKENETNRSTSLKRLEIKTENAAIKDTEGGRKIAKFNDVQINLHAETLSVVPVIPTKEGTVNHLLSLLVDRSWRRALNMELRKDYMHNIVMFLEKEKAKGITVFPPREQIFNAFNLTPLNQVRVVIIGQDPYHDVGQAHGLCFSVNKGVRPPPSLINIYKELKTDIPSFKIPDHGCLVSWARQGVFMLNATLTVEAHKANSHSNIGWQKFTDGVIRIISRETKGVVFLLWGNFAHKKEALVDRKKHTVIKTAHPSPLSARMFIGSRCFSKTNEALIKMGRPCIDWRIL